MCYFCEDYNHVCMNENGNFDSTLLQHIIKGIEEKKGLDIVALDLSGIPGAICKSFVLCNGNSGTQVEAIADSVIDEVRKGIGEKPWHVEGYTNKEWILIDFVDVVVHVFQPDIRDFYGLEELWADAPSQHYTPQY
jgi:ribosome-associated protein